MGFLFVDTPIENFNSNNEANQESFVDTFKRMISLINQAAAIEQERSNDPTWQLYQIHVMSEELFVLLESPDTPGDIKHRILLATYTGNQLTKVE